MFKKSLFAAVACQTLLLSTPSHAEATTPSPIARCVGMNANWRMPHSGQSSLGYQLQHYALQNFGKSVGNGQCADLPNTYLQSVRAKTFYQLGPADTNANYVWGNLVTTATPSFVDLSSVMPGDVVQFRDVVDVESIGNTTYTATAAHHTAVVFAISPDNKQMCVFQQNPGPIGYGWYNLSGLRQGTMWFYRPIY